MCGFSSSLPDVGKPTSLPDVGLLVCPWATSDQQVYDLKWILSFPSARCLDGSISVQFECFISYFAGKISFIHPFIFTERDLSVLSRHCINITKLIRSYEDIQIRISFPCVRLAAFSFVFKLQTAWSWKKKKVISLHWDESCRVMKNCRGGKDSQLLFINSDFDRPREHRDIWSEGPFPEDSSRILV